MRARIGANLRKLRASKSWTLAVLSARTGIDRGTLSAYEHGHHVPRFETLAKIADVYGVPLDALRAA